MVAEYPGKESTKITSNVNEVGRVTCIVWERTTRVFLMYFMPMYEKLMSLAC